MLECDFMEIPVCITQAPGTSQVEIDERTGTLSDSDRAGVDARLAFALSPMTEQT